MIGRAKWQQKLDDLDPGDFIEISCGSTIVEGRFVELTRAAKGKWFIAVRYGKRTELVATNEIDNILVRERKA